MGSSISEDNRVMLVTELVNYNLPTFLRAIEKEKSMLPVSFFLFDSLPRAVFVVETDANGERNRIGNQLAAQLESENNTRRDEPE
jgi:hypothetical protein